MVDDADTAKPFPFIRLKRLQIKEAVLYGSLPESLSRRAIEYCAGGTGVEARKKKGLWRKTGAVIFSIAL